MDSDPNYPSPTKASLNLAKAPDNPPSRGRALGRGLDALLPPAPPPSQGAHQGESIRQIPVSHVDPNPFQPRRNFDPVRLQELAESIKMHGILQPIVVRKSVGPGERFLLIAGERRLRAATLAGVPTISAILRDVPDNAVLELTLVENIQREDLNPIETAEAFARLAGIANLTHEQIAARTGKDRATVTNFLRLLKLPEEVRDRVASGALSMGHARAILAVPTQEGQKSLATRIVTQGLSVRQAETVTKEEPVFSKNPLPAILAEVHKDPNVVAAVQELERVLGTRVRLVGDDMHGKIIIEYYHSEDLDRIYNLIIGRK